MHTQSAPCGSPFTAVAQSAAGVQKQDVPYNCIGFGLCSSFFPACLAAPKNALFGKKAGPSRQERGN